MNTCNHIYFAILSIPLKLDTKMFALNINEYATEYNRTRYIYIINLCTSMALYDHYSTIFWHHSLQPCIYHSKDSLMDVFWHRQSLVMMKTNPRDMEIASWCPGGGQVGCTYWPLTFQGILSLILQALICRWLALHVFQEWRNRERIARGDRIS